MTVGTVQNVDFLLTTDYPDNTSNAITESRIRDGFESAFGMATNTQTASYTAVITDRGQLVIMNVASANNFTVPPNSSVAFPLGCWLHVGQYGAGATTIVAGVGVTIDKFSTLVIAGQFGMAHLLKIGTNEWWAVGQLT